MKTKKVLKFYFASEEVKRTFDRLIYRRAVVPDFYRPAEESVGRVLELIEKKKAAEALIEYLDGVLGEFTIQEASLLRTYALSRERDGTGTGRELHRLATRFTRLALEGIEPYRAGLEIVNWYIVS